MRLDEHGGAEAVAPATGRVVATSRMVTALVVVLALAAYTFGYGPGVVISLYVLRNGMPDPAVAERVGDVQALALDVLPVVMALGLATVAVGLLGRVEAREWVLGRPPGRPGIGMVCAGTAATASLAGYWALVLLRPAKSYVDNVASPLWLDLARDVTAGVGEELVVLALPVVLVRRLAPQLLRHRHTMAALIGLLVVLRMAYHLYYGV